MLCNIKAYQSERRSQHSPSQNSPSYCTPGRLFTNGSFSIRLVAYLFTFTQNALALLTGWFRRPSTCNKWIKKKAASWV